jgi:hypothetical protein
MKFELSWHKDCLRNRKKHNNTLLYTLQKIKESFEEDTAEILFYEQQIQEAEKQGKDGFDSERFMVKKKEEFLK